MQHSAAMADLEAEAKRTAKLLASHAQRDDDELFDVVSTNMRTSGDGLRYEVLELLGEDCFVAAVERLAQVKKDKVCKGLVLSFSHVTRWAASVGHERLELLRRKNGIAALTHVVNELDGAQLHDAIQREDLQVAAFEALGWLAGSESGGYAVASEVIAEQAGAAAQAIERSVSKFPEHTRSKVIGLAALSWCLHQHQKDAAETGGDVTMDEPRAPTVKVILDSLADSSNGDLQTLALLSFGWVSFSHPPTGAALLENNGIQLMVAAMQRHPLNRRLQYYACGTVSWLASQPANRRVPVSRNVTDSGGVEAMVAASRLHIGDWNLQIASSMALCSLVQHGGPGLLDSIVSFGAVEALVAGARQNRSYAKCQFANVVALKCFAMYPWEIAHRRMAQCGALQMVGEFLAEALAREDMVQADEMLEFFYVIDASQQQAGGRCQVTITRIFTDGVIAPMMQRLQKFKWPEEKGALERLQKFLLKLFQLDLGPVGWLSFDTALIRACLEQAVLLFLDQLGGKLSVEDSQRTVRLVVPVVSGLVNQARQDSSVLPQSVVKHSAVLCAYAVGRPALLRGDLRFLVEEGEGGGLLTLEAKRAWLQCEKERLMRLGKSSITIVTGRTGIMQDICQTLTPPGSASAVGISVAFRDERAAGDGLRREWFQLVVSLVSFPHPSSSQSPPCSACS